MLGHVRFSGAEMIRTDGWIRDHFAYPAVNYRSELHCLPQLAIPQNIYEGSRTFSVSVLRHAVLFSNSFLICTSREATNHNLARGVAKIISSSIGRLWLHLFATSGRHLSKTQIESFPLPPRDVVEDIGTLEDLEIRYIRDTDCKHEATVTDRSVESQLVICRAYGLDLRASAVILSVGYILGLNDPLPRSILDSLAPDEGKLEKMIAELESLDLDKESEQGKAIYLKALAEWDQRRYLTLDGDGCRITIDKRSVSE